MSAKSFDYCPKKANFRYEGIIAPVRYLFSDGHIPKGQIIVDTAGVYSKDVTATACWQFQQAGIISGPEQFMGIDNGSKSEMNGEEIDIVSLNNQNYGPHSSYHIPCQMGRIQNFCAKNKDSIAFVSLDLQAMTNNCYSVFVETLCAMEGAKHSFGICFNSIVKGAWNKRQNIGFGTVAENMESFLNFMKNDTQFGKSLLNDYDFLKLFSYAGTGKSASIMGSYVFLKKGQDIVETHSEEAKFSLAAKKAWQTRKENSLFAKRSVAAKKAWDTRRKMQK